MTISHAWADLSMNAKPVAHVIAAARIFGKPTLRASARARDLHTDLMEWCVADWTSNYFLQQLFGCPIADTRVGVFDICQGAPTVLEKQLGTQRVILSRLRGSSRSEFIITALLCSSRKLFD